MSVLQYQCRNPLANIGGSPINRELWHGIRWVVGNALIGGMHPNEFQQRQFEFRDEKWIQSAQEIL